MPGHEALFEENEHQAAWVFEPGGSDTKRTPKRRKVAKKRTSRHSDTRNVGREPCCQSSTFGTLLAGREADKWRQLRQELFTRSWSQIALNIRRILRQANQSTLDDMTSFVRTAATEPGVDSTTPVIPTAFILTGPNIASQDLLFDQLEETLNLEPTSKCVRLRSADCPNLKAALKKIIRDASFQASGPDDEDPELALPNDGRQYLDYDLEALHSHVQTHRIRQVTVAFQDGEAFDSSLIADLVVLFKSWMGRIRFILVLGLATSVGLFEARLSRKTCQSLVGEQFDVTHSAQVLESVFKVAIASAFVPLKLGPDLVKSMMDRQHDHVAGIPAFASSVKYAYMCHFYANPLSILLADPEEVLAKDLQPEHLEAIRELPSFRRHIEGLIEARHLSSARALLTDDAELASCSLEHISKGKEWRIKATRSLALRNACALRGQDFAAGYLEALSGGFLVEEGSDFLEATKRLASQEASSLLEKALATVKYGDEALRLSGWADEDPQLVMSLSALSDELELLQGQSEQNGAPLKSKYSAQSRALRTTVVAQKVQLNQDASTLTSQDRAYTQVMERLADVLAEATSCPAPGEIFLNEAWLFDSKSPYRSVFIPRPGPVMECALGRPQDYLNCACCRTGTGGTLRMGTAPTTSVLYHIYMDAGPLINVSDLWTAFYALVGRADYDDGCGGGERNGKADKDGKGKSENKGKDKGDEGGSDAQEDLEERQALALFYRSLAELRVMGFLKGTKKKVDHVAKLKHLS